MNEMDQSISSLYTGEHTYRLTTDQKVGVRVPSGAQ